VKRLLVFILLVFVACLLAGVYGVVHDQITYTVSPEYYTKFKFRQFGLLDSPLPERSRAAIVGFRASWWMGIPIGILVGAVGFIHPGHRRMLFVSLRSFMLVVGFTLLVGLIGLVYGFFSTSSIDIADYGGWFIPPSYSIRYCALHDYLHVTGVMNANGAVTMRLGYNGYGLPRTMTDAYVVTSSPTPSDWEFRFGCAYWDSETQLYQMRYRYLHPRTGTWMTRDPSGYMIAETGLYRVEKSAPTTHADPDGRAITDPIGVPIPWVTVSALVGVIALEFIKYGRMCSLLAEGEDRYVRTPATILMNIAGGPLCCELCGGGRTCWFAFHVWVDHLGDCGGEYVAFCEGGGKMA
jgi:RHS repeat-associated protein